jgi:PPOX class probable FMN-dependent enzyme
MGLSETPAAHQNSRMTQTIWKPSLVLALYLNRQAPYSRFVQVATVRDDGRPANRTMMFSGFLGETDQLTFHTDSRSAKLADLDHLPWAEACWYFPVTHEQFRIGGMVRVVRGDTPDSSMLEARRAAWRELGEPARIAYNWPAPGQPRNRKEPYPTERPDAKEPLPQFCLIILDPHAVDHLEVNGNPQNRWKYQRDDQGRWSGAEVNP